ncbi:MAG: alpha/beta hydrolase [Nocardioidaceae bacterium]
MIGRPARRSVLAAAGAALLAACSSPAPKPAKDTAKPVRHRYGTGKQQFGDLYLPEGGATRGTVVLIHGGFWQSMYALDLGAALGADLAERGWAAWNIEYRRLGDGGGWPGTFADVAAAVDHVAELDGVDPSQVITLGHSAGGHLAAWAASRQQRDGADLPGGAPQVKVAATVPQAGVLDLLTGSDTGLGGSAVLELMGGEPSRIPGRYRLGDPIERLPLRVPIRCVHGSDDSTVPISQSRSYVDAAVKAGDDARLVEVPGDHFALIDPSTPAWAKTVEVLAALST